MATIAKSYNIYMLWMNKACGLKSDEFKDTSLSAYVTFWVSQLTYYIEWTFHDHLSF